MPQALQDGSDGNTLGSPQWICVQAWSAHPPVRHLDSESKLGFGSGSSLELVREIMTNVVPGIDHERMLDLDAGESASEFFDSRIGPEALDWMFRPGLSGYAFAYPEQVGAAFALATLWHAGLNGVA